MYPPTDMACMYPPPHMHSGLKANTMLNTISLANNNIHGDGYNLEITNIQINNNCIKRIDKMIAHFSYFCSFNNIKQRGSRTYRKTINELNGGSCNQEAETHTKYTRIIYTKGQHVLLTRC
jgi:hypothetical protein